MDGSGATLFSLSRKLHEGVTFEELPQAYGFALVWRRRLLHKMCKCSLNCSHKLQIKHPIRLRNFVAQAEAALTT